MRTGSTLAVSIIIVVGLLSSYLVGGAKDGLESSASYIGDRSSVFFREVLAAVSVEGAARPNQNLHIAMAAIVNPVKSSDDTAPAEQIIRRQEARIASEVLAVALASPTLNARELKTLRVTLASAGQAVIEKAMSQWKHGSLFEVRIVVTSLYFTDPSVAPSGPARAW
jgi:hypothetical protein